MKKKNVERSFDMRNIYVGVIATQSEVDFKGEERIDGFKVRSLYNWEYAEDTVGLFVKVFGGYKHILTGQVYKMGTEKTGGKKVLVHNKFGALVDYDDKTIQHLVKVEQFDITYSQIEKLENRFNKYFQRNEVDGLEV